MPVGGMRGGGFEGMGMPMGGRGIDGGLSGLGGGRGIDGGLSGLGGGRGIDGGLSGLGGLGGGGMYVHHVIPGGATPIDGPVSPTKVIVVKAASH